MGSVEMTLPDLSKLNRQYNGVSGDSFYSDQVIIKSKLLTPIAPNPYDEEDTYNSIKKSKNNVVSHKLQSSLNNTRYQKSQFS